MGQLLSEMALLHSKQVSIVFVALVESLTATAEVPEECFSTHTQSYVMQKNFPRFARNGDHFTASTYYIFDPPFIISWIRPCVGFCVCEVR